MAPTYSYGQEMASVFFAIKRYFQTDENNVINPINPRVSHSAEFLYGPNLSN